MLKAWMINPDISTMVEEKYHTYAEQMRTDRYVTVTRLAGVYSLAIFSHYHQVPPKPLELTHTGTLR